MLIFSKNEVASYLIKVLFFLARYKISDWFRSVKSNHKIC